MYRSFHHGRPVINGYSGYYPPHYLPLVFAIRERQFSVLQEIARGELIGITVNRASSDAAVAEQVLGSMTGVSRVSSDVRWSTFVLQSRNVPSVRLGRELTM
jgi:hypothetical protein